MLAVSCNVAPSEEIGNSNEVPNVSVSLGERFMSATLQLMSNAALHMQGGGGVIHFRAMRRDETTEAARMIEPPKKLIQSRWS